MVNGMVNGPLYRNIKFPENYASISTKDELKYLVDKLQTDGELLGFDIETGYSGPDYLGRATSVYHPKQFIVGFSITNDPRWARYVPLMHDFGTNIDPEFAWELLKPLLENVSGVAHNLQFEAENLKQIEAKGMGPSITIPITKWHDTMIQAFTLSDVPPIPVWGALDNGRLVQKYIPPFHQTPDGFQSPETKSFGVGLKSLTKFRYNYKQKPISSLFDTGEELTAAEESALRFNALPISYNVVHYACDDASFCLQLHKDQIGRIMEDKYLPNVYSLEMQTLEILTEIKDIGLSMDWAGMNKSYAEGEQYLEVAKTKTLDLFSSELGRDMSAMNLNSPTQIRAAIFNSVEEGGMGFESERKTDTGAASTDDKALTTLRKSSAAIDSLLRYRQAVKMLEWFTMWIPLREQATDQKVHPSFNQVRIQSGRFASSNPNCQNVTKHWWFQSVPGSMADVVRSGEAGKDYWTGRARDFIIASPGYTLLSFDYQSAEIQILAALAQEDTIIDAFFKGENFHRWTASIVFSKDQESVTPAERQASKSVSFGNVYGQSEAALAQQQGISKAAAGKIRADYFAKFPKLDKYFAEQHRKAREEFEVRTLLGRKATLWEGMHESSRVRSKAERLSVNVPVQGGATGDYMKLAMIRVRKALIQAGWWNGKVRLLMNQHDSLVFEVHDSLDMSEVIDMLTAQVQFSLAGAGGLYDEFKKFPPMSVDWEVGKAWGTMLDASDAHVLDSTKMEITLGDTATAQDLKTVTDVLALNPGDVPVHLKWSGTETALKQGVRIYPPIKSYIAKGSSDQGIMHGCGESVKVEYV